MTPPRAPFTAAEEADLDDQLEVAEQLLNPNPEQIPCRITRSQWRGAVESLQQERTEPEAESSEPDLFDEFRNLFHTPTPEMTTPSGSAAAASDVKLKVELDDTNEQWAWTISTAVLQTIDNKKDEASKGPTLDPFLGKQSDTRRFLLNLELYFAMNLVKANTDERKKMLLLSLVKGNTSEWKQRETMTLFPEDDDPEEKKKAAE
uniref:Reverse transcriptase-rnase h-integrase n=1 Tax=Moniliophthora roreri TaxID=221103 RepID=A0A0W0FEY8_MONRR